VIVHCAKCQAVLPPPADQVCPNCGSDQVMVAMETPAGTRISAPRDSARMRVQGRRIEGSSRTRYRATVTGPVPVSAPARRPDKSQKAPHIKLYSDVLWNDDRQRMERREMRVDKENDYYRQEWFNLETNETTFVKEGKVSDPDVHGQSARRRSD
jgi:hypothetical protein